MFNLAIQNREENVTQITFIKEKVVGKILPFLYFLKLKRFLCLTIGSPESLVVDRLCEILFEPVDHPNNLLLGKVILLIVGF